MAKKSTKIETGTRLDRNLSLLHAGSMVTIDIVTPAGQRGKFKTVFIGYLAKQYVLIQFPEAHKLGGFSQYIIQGASITVRGLIEGHKGAVLAFVSLVKQTIKTPSRIMVLDFPSSVTLQNLRSAIRVETNIEAKVKINKDYWQTTITNLSINGCHISIENGDKLVLSENKMLEIIVENKQECSHFKLNASVCNLKKQTDGVSFGAKIDKKSDNHIKELLLKIISSEI